MPSQDRNGAGEYKQHRELLYEEVSRSIKCVIIIAVSCIQRKSKLHQYVRKQVSSSSLLRRIGMKEAGEQYHLAFLSTV